MKFWIWHGEPPRGPEQVISSTGVVFDPTPSAYYQVYVPFELLFEGSTDEFRGTYVVFNYSPASHGRWMLANCWHSSFDAINLLLKHPNKEVVKGTLRAVRESWPTFAEVMDNPLDPLGDRIALFQMTDPVDSQDKWLLASFFGPAEINDVAQLTEASTEEVERLLRFSLQLMRETGDGPFALPRLFQYIGEEPDWVNQVYGASKKLKDVSDIAQLLGRLLGG